MRSAAIGILFCALTACGGDDDAGPTGLIADRSVLHYDYTFDIMTRAAHAEVTVIAGGPGNCVQLPFRATGLEAASAAWDGEPAVSATADGSSVTVCGKHGHDVGDAFPIALDAQVELATIQTSQVGYSVTQDANGNSFYYLVSWVGGCDKFGPCDSRPDQFAKYTFHVTHPEAMMVACPGAITEVSPTETQCDFTHDGGPTYSGFGLAAYPRSAWVAHDKGMWGSLHATIYDRPQTTITDAVNPTYHAGYVTWLEGLLGPYPFGPDLRVLTAPTYWSGFEHPGNIILDDGLAKQIQPPYAHNVAHILDHEIAHQWAGDQTTLADTYDFVWKESMAEYLSYAWEDMQEAAAGAQTTGYWKAASAAAKFFPVPGEKPALFDYYGDVYGPGPMILFRQLEVMSSRDQVLAAIKSVVSGPAHAISVDDVVAALQAKTGLDLTAYAAAWIHGTGKPEWPVVSSTYAAGAGATSTVHVVQTKGTDKRCKFHLALTGAQPTDKQLVEVDTFKNGLDQTLTVPTPAFAVTGTTVDPSHECLVFSGTITTRLVPQPWLTERALRTLDGALRQ